MSAAWNETQAAHDQDAVRGFPFSREAERRLERVEEASMLEKFVDPGLQEDIAKVEGMLIDQAKQARELAERWGKVGHPVAAETWQEASRQLGEIAVEVAAVRKAVEV